MNAIPLKEVKKKHIPKGKVKLLFIGRLEKQKSIETLLKAIKHLNTKTLENEFHLNIVGEGSLREKLERIASSLKIQDIVSFKGEQKNVDAYYAKSDVFILPSIWEGFGIVILEAFRAELAVIASNVEGPAELIQHNVNGLLFAKKDDKELADKIADLINNEPKRNVLAKKGYETFSKEYQIDTYVKKLKNLYHSA